MWDAPEPLHRIFVRLDGLKVLGGCILALWVLVIWQGLADWRRAHAFFINASQSLPNWAFLVDLGQFPARGQIVLFDPGRDPLVLHHFGNPPQPFAKIAYGLPGDMVTRQGSTVLVNGHAVATLKPFSHQGEALLPGPTGVVPQGCLFAGTPNKDGLDSRYAAVGFVCRRQIIGTGVSVL